MLTLRLRIDFSIKVIFVNDLAEKEAKIVESANKFIDIEFINAEQFDYKKALEFGVCQLVKHNVATKGLLDAILESVNKNGPYFVVSPKLALAHAAPGDYCLKPAMALVVFDRPISFSANSKHDVQVLVTLSAPNGKDHMDLIAWFARKFGDHSIIEKLIKSKTKNEIEKIIAGEQ